MRTLSARIEFAVVVTGAFGYFILGNILTLLDPNPGPPLSDAGLRSLVVYEGVVLAALLTFLRLRNWPLQRLSMRPPMSPMPRPSSSPPACRRRSRQRRRT